MYFYKIFFSKLKMNNYENLQLQKLNLKIWKKRKKKKKKKRPFQILLYILLSRRFILFYELNNKSCFPFTLCIEEQELSPFHIMNWRTRLITLLQFLLTVFFIFDLIKRFIRKQNIFDYVHNKDQLLLFDHQTIQL